MKFSHLMIAATTLLTVPGIAQSSMKDPTGTVATTAAPTQAAAPVAVQPNAMIFSADGHRIGRVDHVRSINGTPVTASVVFAGQFVNVPVSSLTAKDGGFVSTLKAAELTKR